MNQQHLYLKPTKSALSTSKHPWIFDGALDIQRSGSLPAGIVHLYSADNRFLSVGSYNPQSAIAFRRFSAVEEAIDTDFFIRRFRAAKALRSHLAAADTTGFRWVNSEGDGLPGLTVDGFDGHLVVQVGTPTMHALSSCWLEASAQVFSPKSVTRKDSQSVANRERMTAVQTVVTGEPPALATFHEAGIAFQAAILPGQKTGFFFDQRDHRIQVAGFAKSKRVLDGYAYTGGFGAHALASGAAFVTGVDSSKPACDMMEVNYGLNAPKANCFEVVAEDCVQYLKHTQLSFDIVILDPPALAKKRPHLPQALRLYREIFTSGLCRVAKEGGFLSASSCSAAVDTSALLDILRQSAISANRTAQVIHVGGAGVDHPTSLHHPEGEYLKSVLLRVY